MFGEYAKPLKQQEGETKTGLWQPAQGCARARTHGLGCARARTHGNPAQHTHRFRKASGSMGLGGGVAAFCGGVLMRSLPCARASLSSRLIRRSRISATVRIPWSPGILQARRGAVRRLHSQRAAMASQPAPRDLHPKIQDKALTVGVCTLANGYSKGQQFALKFLFRAGRCDDEARTTDEKTLSANRPWARRSDTHR
jgi:hypothetical protein